MPSIRSEDQRAWLWASFKPRLFFRRYKLKSRHQRWRNLAELLKLSRAARSHLDWIIFYEKNRKDVALTCRHFSIARKTLYKWLKRFDGQFLKGLEEKSRAPLSVRRRQYTILEYENRG